MKKYNFLTFLLASTILLGGFFMTSCTSTDIQNSEEQSSDWDGIIHIDPPMIYGEPFFPTEASDLDVEAFKTDYLNSRFHDKANEFTGQIYNYMPEDYANQYNIGAFEVRNEGYSYYYLWHDGEICSVSIGANPNANFSGFVHFFLSDMNGDGYFELLASHYLDSRLKITYITAYDSETKVFASAWSIYDKVAFFKNTGDGWAIYTSEDNNIDNVTAIYSDIYKNPYTYSFAQKTYQVTASDYQADITIEEGTINFPLYFKNLILRFHVKTSLTWLGETFSYENSTTYLDGAYTEFFNETKCLTCEGIVAGDAITPFTICTGQVIENSYDFHDYSEARNAVGVYDMKISYCFSDEEFVLEDVLTVGF